MHELSFLEKIYFDKIDKNILKNYKIKIDYHKVNNFLSNYRKIVSNYNPCQLEENKKVPNELLQKLKELKIFGLNIDQKYGGLGFNLFEYLKVIEKISQTDLSLAIIPLAHLSIGLKGIVLFGDDTQKEKYLKLAASGEMIFAYALTEPKYGSDAKHIKTTAKLSEDKKYYILNGNKTYITNGNYAQCLTVFANFENERPGYMGAFIVETNLNGVKIHKDMPKMGLSISSTTAISFKNVKIPVDNILGKQGDGFKIAMQILNYGRLGLGAASTGLIDYSLELMLKRTNSRIQFDTLIKNFQLIQGKIVKCKIHYYLIDSMTYFTAAILEQNSHAKAAIESSHCKLYGTTKSWSAIYETQQVYGGAGYLKTQPLEKILRDARVTTIFEGTSEIHSIYPALYLIKHVSSHFKKNNYNKLRILCYFIKIYFKSYALKVKTNDKIIKKSLKLCRILTKQVRKLIVKGMIRYGKKIQAKQFYLRKITEISILNYSLFTFTINLNNIYNKNKNDKFLLKYLEYVISNYKLRLKYILKESDQKSEELNSKLFNNLDL